MSLFRRSFESEWSKTGGISMVVITYVASDGSRQWSQFRESDQARIRSEITKITGSGGKVLSASLK
jgi:hypothetical protein